MASPVFLIFVFYKLFNRVPLKQEARRSEFMWAVEGTTSLFPQASSALRLRAK